MRTETDACPEQALIAGKAKSKSKGAALTRRAECLEPRRRCITKWFSGGCVRKADLTSLRAAREAPAATHLPPPAELQSCESGRPHVARDPRQSHVLFGRSHYAHPLPNGWSWRLHAHRLYQLSRMSGSRQSDFNYGSHWPTCTPHASLSPTCTPRSRAVPAQHSWGSGIHCLVGGPSTTSQIALTGTPCRRRCSPVMEIRSTFRCCWFSSTTTYRSLRRRSRTIASNPGMVSIVVSDGSMHHGQSFLLTRKGTPCGPEIGQ